MDSWIVVLIIFFFLLIFIAVVVGVVVLMNRKAELPGLGQSCVGSGSGECTGNLVCSGGTCLVPVGRTCVVSSQCVNGAWCKGEVCRMSLGGVCTVDSDCGQGKCIDGSCSGVGTKIIANQRKSENDFDSAAVIDAVALNNVTLLLMGSGDIVFQEDSSTRSVSFGVKLRRLFIFENKLYGLGSGRIYRLDSSLESDKFSWSVVQMKEQVSHVSVSHDGKSCWIQNQKRGLLVSKERDFSNPWTELEEQGWKILGRKASSYLILGFDGVVKYQGQQWTGVSSVVLGMDNVPVVEHDKGMRLAVLAGEVVMLE